MCARACACARARVAVARERSRVGEGDGRWLARSPRPRPRTRVWLCRWPRAHGGRRLSFPLSLSSVHSRCLPHRTAAARGCVPSFPSGSYVPFLGGGARPVPRRGKGERPASTSRRPLAVAPGRACRTEPASCEGARPGASARRRSSLPRLPPPNPVRVPSYRVPARRFKDPRGGRLSVPGVGGMEGPVGSRRRPAVPADSRSSRGGGWPFPRHVAAAVVGSGAPSWAPVGLASACPVRRCVVGRGPRVLSVPTRFPSVLFLVSLAGPRRTPLRFPPPPLRGRWVERGTVPPSALFRKENACTTLSGGSLGSCVDEERS